MSDYVSDYVSVAVPVIEILAHTSGLTLRAMLSRMVEPGELGKDKVST